MMFAIPTNFGVDKEEYLNIDYVFGRNIPNDLIDEADAAEKLAGVTSHKTQLSVLSVVDNVQDELDQIEKEQSEQAINSFNLDMNTPLVKQEETKEVDEGIQETERVEVEEEKPLNGAQITSVLKILEEVREGHIDSEQGFTLLVDGLKLDEDAARKIISNYGGQSNDEKDE